MTAYSYNGNSSCFFVNANSTSDVTVNYEGVNYTIPAWSVSIYPDCKNEAYNTAKVKSIFLIFFKRVRIEN